MDIKEQQKVVENLLAIKPDLSTVQLKDIGKIMFGIQFTGSCVRRAREALGVSKKPVDHSEPKMMYVRALLTLFPTLGNAQIQQRTKEFFDEKTRGDILDELRTKSLTPDEATKVVLQFEAQKRTAGIFPADDLMPKQKVEKEHGTKAVRATRKAKGKEEEHKGGCVHCSCGCN